MLFVGPNGCGKTSLQRIIARLWPLPGGQLITPYPRDMVFLPQKPYLPPGTLRDQLTYPDLTSKWTDEVSFPQKPKNSESNYFVGTRKSDGRGRPLPPVR